MPERVLVVEDNERTGASCWRSSRPPAWRGETVTTGADALARCASGDLDVVLLDIQLPDLDGVQVLQRLRAEPAPFSVPVIALTAFAMDGDEARFRSAGFDGYLTKPIDVRRFADQVREVLAGRVAS